MNFQIDKYFNEKGGEYRCKNSGFIGFLNGDFMSMLIVGGDNIEIINCNLSKNGYSIAKHISGRKHSDRCVEIPKNIDLILVLTDYVNHAVSNHIKKESRRLGIKTVYSKRAWASVESSLMG